MLCLNSIQPGLTRGYQRSFPSVLGTRPRSVLGDLTGAFESQNPGQTASRALVEKDALCSGLPLWLHPISSLMAEMLTWSHAGARASQLNTFKKKPNDRARLRNLITAAQEVPSLSAIICN